MTQFARLKLSVSKINTSGRKCTRVYELIISEK